MAQFRRRRRQGRAVLIVVGVGLLGGALAGFELLVPQAPQAHSVLVASGPIRAGQVIGAGDLRAATIASSQVTAIPVTSRDQVVGRTAAFDVAPGQPLVRADVGDAIGPSAGREVVGVFLAPGRFPDGLVAGESVVVLNTPGSQATGSGSGAPPSVNASPAGSVAQLATGRVISVALSADGTHTKVSLEISPASADAVASASASDAVSLVWVPR